MIAPEASTVHRPMPWPSNRNGSVRVRELVLPAAWNTLGAWNEVPQEARTESRSLTTNWPAIFGSVEPPARS